jgi:mono/diheme cytochrome c family protein
MKNTTQNVQTYLFAVLSAAAVGGTLLAGVCLYRAANGAAPPATPTVTAGADGSQAWMAPSRAARRPNPFAGDATTGATGQSVYAETCRVCHGDAGRGDGVAAGWLARAPANLAVGAVAQESDGALFWKIATGNRPMPTFAQRLSENDRWLVVSYLRSFAKDGSQK